ncbi:MAG: 4Fe-4S dicluster domain-containing protein [Chloroflexi bacterium]|nr:4Fe-4S dicluster domain-containing protein [Chloroflexota bacterium]
MTIFKVDNEKCNRCGICVLECPPRIIEIKESGALPSTIQGQEERCIACGHCVAVCPLDAISLDIMSPWDCAQMQNELLPSAGQVELLLKSRRSIRAYKPERVPHDSLLKLIDIARYAPSGHNSQPLHWLIVEDPRETRRLAALVVEWMNVLIKKSPRVNELFHFDLFVSAWERGEDRVLRGAPNVIVAHAPKDTPMAQENAAIALTYLELAAYSMGLGACWAGYLLAAATSFPAMMNELALPGGHRCFGAMMVGYPKHKFRRIPLRNEPHIIWR